MNINKRLSNKILKEGIKVNATITSCTTHDDPDDDEHTIYEIDFYYYIEGNKVEKNITFSINTAHIEYAFHGMMINTPKSKYSLKDFNNSLKKGSIIEIISLEKPPYHFICNFNETSREIMNSPDMWC